MDELLGLTDDLPVRTVRAGDILIEQGHPPGAMYVLIDGTVAVERDGVTVATVDVPGAVFGEMSAVLDQPATATVRVEADARVRVVDEPVAFMLERPEAALAALRTVVKRLDNLTLYISNVGQQYADHANHLGMVHDVLNVLTTQQPSQIRTGSAREPDPDY